MGEEDTGMIESWRKQAREELFETPSSKAAGLETLKCEMCVLGIEIPDENEEQLDAFLLRFLRARKFDATRAARVLRRYEERRRLSPALFDGVSAGSVWNAFRSRALGVLPGPDRSGRTALLLIPKHWEGMQKKEKKYDTPLVTNGMPMPELLRALVYTVERLLESERCQVCGLVLVVDLIGLTWSHANSLLSEARKMIGYLQEGLLSSACGDAEWKPPSRT
ncbi:hypothetical protein CYMTET_53141 [Cymbomonas tetramitiformis]|uniref:CRAL/TRIO N-terminal domain-containing protein n=1 Tax=Cymbomonas tetramitiformis TaxID=36881 RepID=A0AAE0BJ03_9CHLO|nr:hypothetical protein CYMTET_53141 [Cymbomonas tetramitiformis]